MISDDESIDSYDFDCSSDEESSFFDINTTSKDDWIEHLIEVGVDAFIKRYEAEALSEASQEQIKGLRSTHVDNAFNSFDLKRWEFINGFTTFYARFVNDGLSSEAKDKAEHLFDDFSQSHDQIKAFELYFTQYFSEHFDYSLISNTNALSLR